MMHPSSPNLLATQDPPSARSLPGSEPRVRVRAPGERTCVGCGKKAQSEDLVRVVLGPWQEGHAEVAVDFAGGAIGRGAHLHPLRACLERAAAGGFSKSFKTRIRADVDEVARDVVRGSERAIRGLLSAAVARRNVGIGADAAKEAMRAGAPLLVVAKDAGSVVKEFDADIAEGRARVFGDKALLGKLCGKSEVAVLAVSDDKIAGAIVRAGTMAESISGSRSEACRSPEVR